MLLSLPQQAPYTIPPAALARWATQRVRREPRRDGGVVYSFAMSGSTCNNVPLDVLMTVTLGADGRIESATARPAGHDAGCGAMCAALGDGGGFLSHFGSAEEVVGLTLEQATFRSWDPEPSGCFCTAANRRHKWRNVFEALHYSAAHEDNV